MNQRIQQLKFGRYKVSTAPLNYIREEREEGEERNNWTADLPEWRGPSSIVSRKSDIRYTELDVGLPP